MSGIIGKYGWTMIKLHSYSNVLNVSIPIAEYMSECNANPKILLVHL